MPSNLHLSETKARLFTRVSPGGGEREAREPFALVAKLSNQDTQCFNGMFLKSKLMKKINKEENINILNTDRICPRLACCVQPRLIAVLTLPVGPPR